MMGAKGGGSNFTATPSNRNKNSVPVQERASRWVDPGSTTPNDVVSKMRVRISGPPLQPDVRQWTAKNEPRRLPSMADLNTRVDIALVAVRGAAAALRRTETTVK